MMRHKNWLQVPNLGNVRLKKRTVLVDYRTFVFVCSGCYNKIPQTRWLTQQTCISHSPGDWQVQDQGAGRFGAWWGPSFWFSDRCFIAVPSYGGEREGALGSFSYESTNLIMGEPASLTSSKLIISQRPHLWIPSHWGLGLQHLRLNYMFQLKVMKDLWGLENLSMSYDVCNSHSDGLANMISLYGDSKYSKCSNWWIEERVYNILLYYSSFSLGLTFFQIKAEKIMTGTRNGPQ